MFQLRRCVLQHGTNTTYGIIEIQIDGITYNTADFNAALSRNIKEETKGIFLSAGTHIIKIVSPRTTSGQHSWVIQIIELIKRDGENQGDDEATSLLLFGEELQQKADVAITSNVLSSQPYNTQTFQVVAGTGQGREGDVFLKRGTYNITLGDDTQTNRAGKSLFVGGVTVFDNDTSWDIAPVGVLQITSQRYRVG